MLTLLLTVLTLIVVYLLQQGHPLIAGIVPSPVKIVATSLMVFEDGGIPRLGDRRHCDRTAPWTLTDRRLARAQIWRPRRLEQRQAGLCALEVGLDHHLHQPGKRRLSRPAKAGARLGGSPISNSTSAGR